MQEWQKDLTMQHWREVRLVPGESKMTDNSDETLFMLLRQAWLSILDIIERYGMSRGLYRGQRTAELRKQLRATRKECK